VATEEAPQAQHPVLANYGERIQPPVRELRDEQNQALRGRWVRREQLMEMLGLEENRLEHAPKALHRSPQTHVADLRKQIKQADHDLDCAVRNSSLWDQYELLSSVPAGKPGLAQQSICWRPLVLVAIIYPCVPLVSVRRRTQLA
jgi:hypothetical protein